MEMLHDSGLVGSLDLVELNPYLDDRGKSARTVTEADREPVWTLGPAA